MTTGTVNLHIDDWFSCVTDGRGIFEKRAPCTVYSHGNTRGLPRNARGAASRVSVRPERARAVRLVHRHLATASWYARVIRATPALYVAVCWPPAARAGPRRPPRPRASRSPPPPPPRWPPSTPPSPLFLFLFRAPRASVSATSRPPAARFARAAAFGVPPYKCPRLDHADSRGRQPRRPSFRLLSSAPRESLLRVARVRRAFPREAAPGSTPRSRATGSRARRISRRDPRSGGFHREGDVRGKTSECTKRLTRGSRF